MSNSLKVEVRHNDVEQETKKPKLAAEDFRIWEEHVAAKDQPMSMSLEQEATFSNDKTEMVKRIFLSSVFVFDVLMSRFFVYH